MIFFTAILNDTLGLSCEPEELVRPASDSDRSSTPSAVFDPRIMSLGHVVAGLS